MKTAMAVSFSFLMLAGGIKTCISAENPINSFASQVQVELIKFQSIQQSEINNINANTQSKIQSLMKQLQTMTQIITQLNTANVNLQKQLILLQKESDVGLNKLQSDMANEIKSVQSILISGTKTLSAEMNKAAAAAAKSEVANKKDATPKKAAKPTKGAATPAQGANPAPATPGAQ